MNSKKKLIIIVSILVIIAIGFGIFKMVSSFKEDQKNAEKNMVIINENYEKFNQYIEQFNKKSESLQTVMGAELFYTSLATKNIEIVKSFDEINQIVNNILNIDKILKNKCKIYYKDSEVNQKCQSYNISTESVMTVFKEAVANYNDVITSYNTWIKKSENSNYKPINLYQIKI